MKEKLSAATTIEKSERAGAIINCSQPENTYQVGETKWLPSELAWLIVLFLDNHAGQIFKVETILAKLQETDSRPINTSTFRGNLHALKKRGLIHHLGHGSYVSSLLKYEQPEAVFTVVDRILRILEANSKILEVNDIGGLLAQEAEGPVLGNTLRGQLNQLDLQGLVQHPRKGCYAALGLNLSSYELKEPDACRPIAKPIARDRILEIVDDSRQALFIDDVCDRLASKMSKPLSRLTVCRTLSLLKQQGKIKPAGKGFYASLSLEDKHCRFQFNPRRMTIDARIVKVLNSCAGSLESDAVVAALSTDGFRSVQPSSVKDRLYILRNSGLIQSPAAGVYAGQHFEIENYQPPHKLHARQRTLQILQARAGDILKVAQISALVNADALAPLAKKTVERCLIKLWQDGEICKLRKGCYFIMPEDIAERRARLPSLGSRTMRLIKQQSSRPSAEFICRELEDESLRSFDREVYGPLISSMIRRSYQ